MAHVPWRTIVIVGAVVLPRLVLPGGDAALARPSRDGSGGLRALLEGQRRSRAGRDRAGFAGESVAATGGALASARAHQFAVERVLVAVGHRHLVADPHGVLVQGAGVIVVVHPAAG